MATGMTDQEFHEAFLYALLDASEQAEMPVWAANAYPVMNEETYRLYLTRLVNQFGSLRDAECWFMLMGGAVRSYSDPSTKEYEEAPPNPTYDPRLPLAGEIAYKNGIHQDMYPFRGTHIQPRIISSLRIDGKRAFRLLFETGSSDYPRPLTFKQLMRLRDILSKRRISHSEFLLGLRESDIHKRWKEETEDVLFDDDFRQKNPDLAFFKTVAQNFEGKWPVPGIETIYVFDKTAIFFDLPEALYWFLSGLETRYGGRVAIFTKLIYRLDVQTFVDEGIDYLLGEGILSRVYDSVGHRYRINDYFIWSESVKRWIPHPGWTW